MLLTARHRSAKLAAVAREAELTARAEAAEAKAEAAAAAATASTSGAGEGRDSTRNTAADADASAAAVDDAVENFRKEMAATQDAMNNELLDGEVELSMLQVNTLSSMLAHTESSTITGSTFTKG